MNAVPKFEPNPGTQQNSGVTLENSRGQSLKSSLFLIKCGTLSENWFYFFMRTCELKRERYLIFAIKCLFLCAAFRFFCLLQSSSFKTGQRSAIFKTLSALIHIKDKIVLFVCMYQHA